MNPPSFEVFGEPASIPFSPPFVASSLIFSLLPLQGFEEISGGLEEQPSGQIELESTFPKSFLQTVFRPGGEINIDGIPLRINNAQITELPRSAYPDSRCRLSISFGSKWENYLDDVCFLRNNGTNQLPSDEPFQDPECLTQSPPGQDQDPNATTTVANLFSKIGIPYIGGALPEVVIPEDTPIDAVVSPSQLMEERLRIGNSFVRWSNAQGVEIVPINSLRTWFYSEDEILGEVQTSYEAIARPSKIPIFFPNINPPLPDLVNFPSEPQPFPVPQLVASIPTALGFEYPNSELTGEFSQPVARDQERTQGNSPPQYIRRDETPRERIVGDVNAHIPLEGVSNIQVMSLCFDIGGQTKDRTIITEVADAPILEIKEIWGFAYYADQIYDLVRERLYGNPDEYWVCLKRVTTSYSYDSTGYLLSVRSSGYNTARYKQESTSEPETLTLDPEDSNYELYQFIRIPVSERTSYYLRLVPGSPTEGLFDIFKQCNQDGTRFFYLVLNPNYAPPYYVEYERTESVSFASRSNPENEGLAEGEKRLPDLVIGEESRFEAYTQVIPAQFRQILTFQDGSVVTERGAEISPQRYIKYIKKFKAQGEAIASALEEIYTETGPGELPLATRRPPLYIEEEPYNPEQTIIEEDQQQYRYLIQTDGYAVSDPVNGSENFSAAQTLEQALTAARCKLAVENWRNGFSETVQIPGNPAIREGNRFNYWMNGEYRQRIVINFKHRREILGVVNGVPRVTMTSDLTLGPYVNPGLSFTQIPIPPEPTPPDVNFTILNVIDAELGSILDWATIQSRRNPLF